MLDQIISVFVDYWVYYVSPSTRRLTVTVENVLQTHRPTIWLFTLRISLLEAVRDAKKSYQDHVTGVVDEGGQVTFVKHVEQLGEFNCLELDVLLMVEVVLYLVLCHRALKVPSGGQK